MTEQQELDAVEIQEAIGLIDAARGEYERARERVAVDRWAHFDYAAKLDAAERMARAALLEEIDAGTGDGKAKRPTEAALKILMDAATTTKCAEERQRASNARAALEHAEAQLSIARERLRRDYAWIALRYGHNMIAESMATI